ncbi:MAG: CAP domain-containing protein [Oligoflexia bacterium]|nr:CAP domain-containing protein [Oligoflexia bacterium]
MFLPIRYRKNFLVLLLLSAGITLIAASISEAQPRVRLRIRQSEGIVRGTLRVIANEDRFARRRHKLSINRVAAGRLQTVRTFRTRKTLKSFKDYVPDRGIYSYEASLDGRVSDSVSILVDPTPDPVPTIALPNPGPVNFLVPIVAPLSECPTDFVTRHLACINSARTREGLAPYELHPALTAAARTHAILMAQTGVFEHGSWLQETLDFGFTGPHFSQNIWYYISDPCAAVDALLTSPGHRANLLNPTDRHVGIGCAIDANGKLWAAENMGS